MALSNLKTLTIRTASATVAVLAVLFLYLKYNAFGLKILCFIAVFLGIRELNRILFKDHHPFVIKALFAVLTLSTFLTTILYADHSTLGFACISILFCCFSIVFEKNFPDLTSLSLFQAKSILGFFYMGLLPAMAYRILDLQNGVDWFLLLLIVVLSGDTMAYVTGMLWGNKKILPNISPKKTVVGAIGGLVGSMIGAAFYGYFQMINIPILSLMLVAATTGIVAQLGDLFESMLKRVANLKDSGSLMPGHGGVLDRIDGILFGAPIILFWALFIQRLI